jgi:hypothetical protein
MKRLITAAILAASLVPLTTISAAAAKPLPSNAQRALQWLQCTQQQANGQIGSGGNPIARSSEVALGLSAAGEPASAMRAGSFSLADYLKTAVSTDVGTNGELLLARVSQPDTGETLSLVAQLELAKSNGEYGSDLFSDALAILGLSAAGQSVGDDSVKFLSDHQAPDGGWSFDGSDKFTDSNTTAIVVMALISAGVPSDRQVLVKAFDYLGGTFNEGGFGGASGAPPDGNSDELVVQAILVAGRQDSTAWQAKVTQALEHLAGQQLAQGGDAGAINGFSKLFATTYAASAFLLRPITSKGLAEEKLPLLPCSASSAATPTAAPAARLAQTGSAGLEGPLGVVILLLGAGLMRRRPSRSRPE